MRSHVQLAFAALLLGCPLAILDAGLAGAASARTLTWARAGDAASLDPHAVAEVTALALNQQVYEPLLQRDSQGKTQPVLALSWTPTSDPLVWEFRLRQGVVFHDGSPFTADDVLFSIERARQPASELAPGLAVIETVSKVDATVVRIKTRAPTTLLPALLTRVLIMSKAWAEKNKVVQVPAAAARFQARTNRDANGTGPFQLVSREPGVRTVLRRNDTYWGRREVPLEITELIYRPIRNDTERVQALVSGEVDFLQDVPVNELPRLRTTPGLVVNVGPESRSVFLALDVGDAELASSPQKGRNPFADKKVRQAVNIAINRQEIQKTVMLGQSIPTGIIAPPVVNGYTRQLDQIPPFDLAKAKALMAEAGFAAGFAVRLDCPNDRFIQDAAICRALAGQLAPIGITVEVAARPAADLQALIRANPPGTDFYLTGWNATTFDSESMFMALFHTRNDAGGALNATRYSNPDVDRLVRELTAQTDFVKRNQMIAQLWRIAQDDVVYIPLHLQTIAYAMKSDIDIPSDIENLPKLKLVKFGRIQ